MCQKKINNYIDYKTKIVHTVDNDSKLKSSPLVLTQVKNIFDVIFVIQKLYMLSIIADIKDFSFIYRKFFLSSLKL